MIPIPGFENVRCNWIVIKSEGFSLYGFILYLASDHYFPEYMSSDGLLDLEILTGKELAVFIIQSPSEKWIEYTRVKNHTWWKLFGKYDGILEDIQDKAVIRTDTGMKTLREIFAPCLNEFLHGDEIAGIIRRFGRDPAKDHPCILLFRDLNDRDAWFVNCRDMLNVPTGDLRNALTDWFNGPYFKKIMKEVSNA